MHKKADGQKNVELSEKCSYIAVLNKFSLQNLHVEIAKSKPKQNSDTAKTQMILTWNKRMSNESI